MSVQQKHNFGAGPCILPSSVMEKAAQAVLNWNNSGLSILEVSHRSPEFESVVTKTQLLIRELLNVPEDHEVLFLQGGASSQFSMVAQNFLLGSKYNKAAYLDTGYFAQKAISQAKHFGSVAVVASSREKDYNYIPDHYATPHDVAYLHCTSNNTIEGTEIFEFPNLGIPLICDMSSDIFSRKIDVDRFSLIYAGAQKNMGPAGMTLVIIKRSMLAKIKHAIPAMSDYRVFNENNSLYNTPPVFSIYVSMLNLSWLKEQGGVKEIEAQNIKKAALLYQTIDQSSIFYGTASVPHRSRMNVTFKCHDPKLEEVFLKYVSERGIVGLKGYRTFGGFRASLYNALPLQSVVYLVSLMTDFEREQELVQANSNIKITA